MRTTVDIDEDLLKELREQVHKTRKPLKKVLNTVLRRGLEADKPSRPRRPYRCPVFAMGDPARKGVDLNKALVLAANLEDAESARKLELLK
jgi:hypothetical protein